MFTSEQLAMPLICGCSKCACGEEGDKEVLYTCFGEPEFAACGAFLTPESQGDRAIMQDGAQPTQSTGSHFWRVAFHV